MFPHPFPVAPNSEMANMELVDEIFGELLRDLRVRVLPTTLPITPGDVEVKSTRDAISKTGKYWDFVKVRVWQLTPYRRVVFLDGDVFFVRNQDSFFDMNDCSRVAGRSSPFNAGYFRADPSQKAYNELLTIVRTGRFDKVEGWNRQCVAGKPDVTNGRLCTRKEKADLGPKVHRVGGGESTQGLFAYYCDVVRDMNNNTMIDAGDYVRGPYGCRLEDPIGINGRCRTIAEGVGSVHATGHCGKHPVACRCPELYDAWWAAQEINNRFLVSETVNRSIAKYGELVGRILASGGDPVSVRNGYWVRKCPSGTEMGSGALLAAASPPSSPPPASGSAAPLQLETMPRALPLEFQSRREEHLARLIAFFEKAVSGKLSPGSADAEFGKAELREHKKQLAQLRARQGAHEQQSQRGSEVFGRESRDPQAASKREGR